MSSAKAKASASPTLIRALERSLGYLAAGMLFAMMVLTFIDVVGRYFFHAPVQGAYELIAIAMGVLIFSALPVVTARDDHLTIGLAENLIRGRARRLLDLLFSLICFCVLAGFAWCIGQHAAHLARTGEVMVSLRVVVAPFAFFMCVMAIVSAVIMALITVARARQPAGG